MSARAYVYRCNGTYYFRWSIPLACRLRLPLGSRLSYGFRLEQPSLACSASCCTALVGSSSSILSAMYGLPISPQTIFRDYDGIFHTLPKNWRYIHAKTGKSRRKIADDPTAKKNQLSPKTLKEKRATLKQFCDYLRGQGSWHGRYGENPLRTRQLRARLRNSFETC